MFLFKKNFFTLQATSGMSISIYFSKNIWQTVQIPYMELFWILAYYALEQVYFLSCSVLNTVNRSMKMKYVFFKRTYYFYVYTMYFVYYFQKTRQCVNCLKKCKFCKTRFIIFYFIILFLSEVAGLGLVYNCIGEKTRKNILVFKMQYLFLFLRTVYRWSVADKQDNDINFLYE